MTFTAADKVRASELNAQIAAAAALAPAEEFHNQLSGQTTTSITFVDLAGFTPVTLTVGASGLAVAFLSTTKRATTTSTTSYVGVSVTGATTVAATTSNALVIVDANLVDAGWAGTMLAWTGLTPGSTTFTPQHRGTAAGTFATIYLNLRVLSF